MTTSTKTYYRGQTDNPSDIGQYWTTDRDAAIHYATNGLRQDGYLLTLTARLSITETTDSVLCWGPEECDKHIGTADALAGPDSIIGATSNITGYYIPAAADMADSIEASQVSPDGDDDDDTPETFADPHIAAAEARRAQQRKEAADRRFAELMASAK